MGERQTSYLKILAKHIFTPFNLVNLVLAALVAYTGSLRNLLFIFIAVFNSLIGAANEIRAKAIVDKLALISATMAKKVQGDETIEIPATDLRIGDVIKLGLGDQIAVDAEVISGSLEVSEALVTGESHSINKKAGMRLISGSFVVSGECFARVKAVGAETFAAKLQKEAKEIKPAKSELFRILNKIIENVGILIIPVGALLFLSQYQAAEDVNSAILSVVAALVAMIPEGLYLLTSSVLTLASIRLARKKVLTQDLYAVETLARVDTICLDKTGTITTGNLKFVRLVSDNEQELVSALKILTTALAADTSTSRALAEKFRGGKSLKVLQTLPFSSERKISGVKTEKGWIYMGATEFVLRQVAADENKEVHGSGQILKKAENLAKNFRVIAVAKEGKFLGFALLADEIRASAKGLLKYFRENDVSVKIISGDNQETITKIAQTVGFVGANAVNLAEEQPKTAADYEKMVEEYNIFARVTPEQKRELVAALERRGHTVAMTGDGVNDVLAMKEADSSIAIGAGTDAAREVAKFVLLDSNFDRIPEIIAEGRRSINNLERSATLFLNKTVYATLLAVSFVFLGLLGLAYPFIPIEMTLLNTLTIGVPAFVLALEPNHERVKKDNFVRMIRTFSIPSGLTVFSLVVLVSVIANIFDLSSEVITTLSAIAVFSVGINLIYRISKPLTKMRKGLIFGLVGAFIVALLVPKLARFFGFFVIFG